MPKKSQFDQIMQFVKENKYEDAIKTLKHCRPDEVKFDYVQMETYIYQQWKSYLVRITENKLDKVKQLTECEEFEQYFANIKNIDNNYHKIAITPDLEKIENRYVEKKAMLHINAINQITEINNLFSYISHLHNTDSDIFRNIVNKINKIITDRILLLIEQKQYKEGLNFISTLNHIEWYKSTSILDGWRKKIINAILLDIKNVETENEIQNLKSLISDINENLSNSEVREFNYAISEKHVTIRESGKVILNTFEKFHNKGDIENARKILEKIKSFYGEADESYTKSFQKLNELIELKKQEKEYNTTKAEIETLLQKFDVDKARAILGHLKSYPLFSKEDNDHFDLLISNVQEKIDFENSLHGKQPLIVIEPSINVPKKINEGEDADPLIIADANTNWGIIGVFDGMGGSGARKYTNILSGEEHTAAFWASRIVRNCVCKLINDRPIGDKPEQYIENELHEAIEQCLNNEINKFSGVSTIKSKMIRRLPTTMALAFYQINGQMVKINCYWAGDSRIYLLTENSIHFLTKDDANTEDPFAPENMDLAMSNPICQDDEFQINKSVIELPMINGPIALIAASDGCFGYFKNPILFELMLRNSIKNAQSWNDIMPRIEKAIIDNIQQDDFSMCTIVFGNYSFKEFSEKMGCIQNINIFEEFINWYESYIKNENNLKSNINKISNKIAQLRSSDPSDKILELTNGLQEAKDTIKGLIEKAKSLDVVVDSTQSLKFLTPWESRIANLTEDKASIQSKVDNLNQTLQDLKSELDSLQERGIIDNNKWYYNYRDSEFVHYVKPISQI